MAKKQANTKTAKPARASQFNFAQDSYLESTSRPLYGLLFLLPLMVIYEVGTLWVNTEQVAEILIHKRIIAFIWLSNVAEWLGLGPGLTWLFPALVVVIILLCWHLVRRHPWKIRVDWLAWMVAESILLCVPLLVLNATIGSSTVMATLQGQEPATTTAGESFITHVVTGIGAGIYEELVFRLILFGLILMILEDLLKIKSHIATLTAVGISAVLFSLYHYFTIDAGGFRVIGTFDLSGFVFRILAGMYFAFVFRYRGYGITAGAHAAYDILLKALWG